MHLLVTIVCRLDLAMLTYGLFFLLIEHLQHISMTCDNRVPVFLKSDMYDQILWRQYSFSYWFVVKWIVILLFKVKPQRITKTLKYWMTH